MGVFIFEDLTSTPTISAPGRKDRSDQTGAVDINMKKDDEVCFFCKGNESLTPVSLYQDSDDWNVRVFKNKFPIVEDHEIIVHSPEHDKDIEELPHEQNVRYIRALLNRVHFYTGNQKEILIFNNKGGRAGASLTHPHTQLIALRGFPGIIELEKNRALQFINEHDTCYWCAEIKTEIEYKKRVVFESPHFLLFVPKACRWSYEMVLIPKEHKPNFEYISEVEINDLAQILKAGLYAYDQLLGSPDRNFWVHTQMYDPYHWHIGFIPQIKVIGGFELGAGIWVSDKASPEEAANKLGPLVSDAYKSQMSSPLY